MRYHVTVAGRTVEVDLSGTHVLVDGEAFDADLHPLAGTPLRQLVTPGRTRTFGMTRTAEGWELVHRGEVWQATVVDERTRMLREMTGRGQHGQGQQVVRAPMPGLVLRVEVEPGARVAAGTGLVVLEAMKMENELAAPVAGEVTAVHVTAGQAVEKGTPLVEVSGEG